MLIKIYKHTKYLLLLELLDKKKMSLELATPLGFQFLGEGTSN